MVNFLKPFLGLSPPLAKQPKGFPNVLHSDPLSVVYEVEERSSFLQMRNYHENRQERNTCWGGQSYRCFWGSKVQSTTKPRNDVWNSRGLLIVFPAMKQEEFSLLTFPAPLFLLLSFYYMIVFTRSRFTLAFVIWVYWHCHSLHSDFLLTFIRGFIFRVILKI